MRNLILAALAVLASPLLSWSSGDEDVRAMLRAARLYADEDGRQAKEPDADLLLSIADEQYRAGDAEGARDTVRAATGIHVEGACPISNRLLRMARVQWETGGVAEASATMKAVFDAGVRADRKEKEECLLPLAELRSDLGDMEGALATASLIPGARKTDLYPHIAAAFARQARWDEAVSAVALASPMKGDFAYYTVMARRAGAGHWSEAGAAMKKVDDRTDGFYSYAAIEAAAAGNIDEAMKIAKSVKRPDFHLWWKITTAMANHGRSAEAIRLASSKLSKNPDGQAMALIHIADAQEQSGDAAGAERTRLRALEVSAKGQPEGHMNRRLLVLAHQGRFDEIAAIRKGGDRLGWTIKDLCAEGRVDAAIRLADMVGMAVLEHDAAEPVIRAQIHKGDVAAALKSVDSIGRSAVWQHGRLLHEIAVEQARQGDIPGALATVRRLDATFPGEQSAAIEAVAQAQAASAYFPRPPGWIAGLQNADEKARAWLGSARGMRLWAEASSKRRY